MLQEEEKKLARLEQEQQHTTESSRLRYTDERQKTKKPSRGDKDVSILFRPLGISKKIAIIHILPIDPIGSGVQTSRDPKYFFITKSNFLVSFKCCIV
jgi:hypothetical protein